MTIHLMKLAVGARDPEHLRHWQAERIKVESPLRHRTRHGPRRVEEILDGGSLYWIVNGFMSMRQRILDIRPDTYEDGSACSALILDPMLVPVDGPPTKPFQGWRYLNAASAPADLASHATRGDELPQALRRALKELCLI